MINLRNFFFFVACLFASVNNIIALDESDRNAIQNVIQGYTDSWNLHQGKGFADGYTDDADFVNIFGMYMSGKAAIEERHIKILQTFFKDSQMAITGIKLREVKPDIAIALVKWKVDGYRDPGSDNTKPGETREGIYTQVFIKKDGNWKITASQNTLKN